MDQIKFERLVAALKRRDVQGVLDPAHLFCQAVATLALNRVPLRYADAARVARTLGLDAFAYGYVLGQFNFHVDGPVRLGSLCRSATPNDDLTVRTVGERAQQMNRVHRLFPLPLPPEPGTDDDEPYAYA